MFPDPHARTGYLKVVAVDGFGNVFDPAVYLQHLQNPQPVEFTPTTPDLPVYEYEETKGRPAGWWDKTPKGMN